MEESINMAKDSKFEMALASINAELALLDTITAFLGSIGNANPAQIVAERATALEALKAGMLKHAGENQTQPQRERKPRTTTGAKRGRKRKVGLPESKDDRIADAIAEDAKANGAASTGIF